MDNIEANNPGGIPNIEMKWAGMREKQTDPDRVQFINYFYGIRALMKWLMMLRNTRQATTLTALSSAMSKTKEWEAKVSNLMGLRSPYLDTIDIYDRPTAYKLIGAIITIECGEEHPYTEDDIYRGIAMAL